MSERYGRTITLNLVDHDEWGPVDVGTLVLRSCLRCGSVVDDLRAHNMWHDEHSQRGHDPTRAANVAPADPEETPT